MSQEYTSAEILEIAKNYGQNHAEWSKIETEIRRIQSQLKTDSPPGQRKEILESINRQEKKLEGKRNFTRLPQRVRNQALKLYRSSANQ